jgi:hypothetical protein
MKKINLLCNSTTFIQTKLIILVLILLISVQGNTQALLGNGKNYECINGNIKSTEIGGVVEYRMFRRLINKRIGSLKTKLLAVSSNATLYNRTLLQLKNARRLRRDAKACANNLGAQLQDFWLLQSINGVSTSELGYEIFMSLSIDNATSIKSGTLNCLKRGSFIVNDDTFTLRYNQIEGEECIGLLAKDQSAIASLSEDRDYLTLQFSNDEKHVYLRQ